MDTGSVLISTLLAILTAIVTSAVSVRLALRRFRAERWFDRKVHAYEALFEATTDFQRHSEVHLSRIEEGIAFRNEYLAQLAERASHAYSQIRKSAAMGEFMFSTKSAERIHRFAAALELAARENDVHERHSLNVDAASGALTDLRALAKADLRTTDRVV